MSKQLNSERRKLIEEHLSSCWCLRRIAAALCVVASGVSREVSRAMAGRLSIVRVSRKSVRRGCAPGLVIIASTIRRRIKADWARTRGNLRRRGKPCLSRAERRAQSRNRIPNRVHFSSARRKPTPAPTPTPQAHSRADASSSP